MFSPFDPFLFPRRFVLLDGGLATELERVGHDLNDPLWSARILMDDPSSVEDVHRSFLEAGADCITTGTYQATVQGLANRGLSPAGTERIFRLSVELAVRARDDFWASKGNRRDRIRPIVAASVGPYGAFLADGSEYRGDYDIGPEALADFHRERWRLLASTSADIMACETIPSLTEAKILAGLARKTGKPAWVGFSCRDAGHLCDGTPIREAGKWADKAPGILAVGVNCVPPAWIPGLITALSARTNKPVVAYPNAGGTYDPAAKSWTEANPAHDWGEACRSWVAAGAAAVGGCCRVGPRDIRRMRKALEEPVEVA